MDKCSDRLKKIRLDIGISQQKMADRIGRSFSTYRRAELGKYPIPSDVLIYIDKLGYSVDWVLTGGGEMRKPRYDPSLVIREPRTRYVLEEFPRVLEIVQALRARPDLIEHIYHYLQSLISKPK